jgi:hypothetical protein
LSAARDDAARARKDKAARESEKKTRAEDF